VIARLRHAEHVTFADAKHEIMMELDPVRAQFWEAFDAFVGRVIPPRAA
jgi:lysophospholipase